MLKQKLGIKDNNNFPIDKTFIIGSRLNNHYENIIELLTYQNQMEEPFNISEKTLTKLGTELRKFDDALAEYRGAIGA